MIRSTHKIIIMKKILITLLLIAIAGVLTHHRAVAQTLDLKWKTDTLLRVPESVLFDASKNVLYVACIDGKPDGKDGVGPSS